MKLIDILFYRLFYLYRKEKKHEAIQSASNFLSMIILAMPLSIFSIIYVIVNEGKGLGLNIGRPVLFLICAPSFFIVSYFVTKHYKKTFNKHKAEEYAQLINIDLFSLFMIVAFFVLLPFIIGSIFYN